MFPWAAVCRLTYLQQLRITADFDHDLNCGAIVRGTPPAALSRLTALQELTVLGMDTWQMRRDSDEPLLPALPALGVAALQLHTLSDEYPGLGRRHQVVLSRIVSLSLVLRYNAKACGLYEDTQLPAIFAPALTELTLADMSLAPGNGELSWLSGLPSLRRLVLKDLETPSSEIPQGLVASSGLTALVLEGVSLPPSNDDDWDDWPCFLRGLPAAGPYLSKLVHLSLRKNGFSTVPPCLAAATALELLDLGKQKSSEYDEDCTEPMLGLQVLEGLTRLRSVNLEGSDSGVDIQCFRRARPRVNVML